MGDDAERIAADLLGAVDHEALADRLVAAFKATPSTAIASRVGRRDGGYIHEMEAASEVLEEMLQPFCDGLERRARAGFTDDAVQLGLGLLSGLYRLPTEADSTSLIGWRETEQAAPAWAGIAGRPQADRPS
jgi:hypothetical protein